MIKLTNISKTAKNESEINNLNINVKKGSVYGLIGAPIPSKTALLNILAGIERPDSGEVLIDNEPVFENLSAKGKLSYMATELFFGAATTVENIGGFYAGLYTHWSLKKFNELNNIFDIDPKLKIKKLSNETKKLLAFLLSIATQAEIMLFDEPFKGLDRTIRAKMWDILLKEIEKRDVTVFISSNSICDLEKVCTHIGVIYDGKLVMEKSLSDIKSTTHKLQIAIDGAIPSVLIENLKPVQQYNYGSVTVLIVKGSEQDIINVCKQYSPHICDILPLSIKEIFIYELGGLGYDLENIIL